VTGYLHRCYAESLGAYGTLHELPLCQGWVLDRPISGFSYRDAMGCYPLFACRDWSQLHKDLDKIGDTLVSVALVTDPFGEYDEKYLHKCFTVVRPFKAHYIADLDQPLNQVVSKHHNYYARRALRDIEVERCDSPIDYLDEWVELYDCLIQRHGLRGIQAFSKDIFSKQLTTPGIVMFRALYKDKVVGAHLWCEQGQVAYSHLTAFNVDGYQLNASYALYFNALQDFSKKLRWVNLGAGAGVSSDGNDGLSRFKKGWSTETRTVYFCGCVFDQMKYREITLAKGVAETDYFPSYRKGEFL